MNMDPSIVFTQEKDTLHPKCPTQMSTEDMKNRNSSQNSLDTYPAINSSQLQIPPAIISSSQVFILAGIIPASYNNQLEPIFTNAIPIENIQIPIIPILNIAKAIDCSQSAIENKLNLSPEIPEQIYTLPYLELKPSETHDIQDQISISSNMEQPTKPNKVEELAKISDHSKKIPLRIEIPKLPPPKSLFPLYSTPPGGIILKPLEVPSDQLPATSNFHFSSPFASTRENQFIGHSAQNYSHGASCDSQEIISQTIPQSAAYNNYSIQPIYEDNAIQPATQAHIKEYSIEPQPLMQYQHVDPHYTETNPIFSYSTTMTNLNTAPQL